jgi:hypothetical protein
MQLAGIKINPLLHRAAHPEKQNAVASLAKYLFG